MKGWMGKSRILFSLTLLMLVLSGCGKTNLTALDPKGEGAESIYDLMMLSVIIMTGVGIVVLVIYTFVLIRYRRREGHEDYVPKQTEGNKFLEILWTVIPILLLVVLAIPTVQKTFMLADTTPSAEDEKDAIKIEVSGQLYWWHYTYNGQEIQASQDLYIPTGERVYLNLKSQDVIHSFWVPSLAGKMDTNPGENENEMFIQAYEEGVYYGKCTEFCGPSHSIMDFKIVAVSPEEFDQWVSDMQNVNADATPESASAQEGKELFKQQACIGCHAIGSYPNSNVGPNLTNFGDRVEIAGVLDNDKESLVDWLQDPEKYKPGNLMTGKYGDTESAKPLTDEEASKIADYLLQLKPSEVSPESAEADE
ncbi:cytochrome B [Pontibacillus halophilus JSM 076056 = DSM 19796]|uniref:Cytochrome c oxidase subunit 2 n=1 Tax=Pontibacillus halophilus JSM 076056 = DSM 19796 TaxID=1385510 RepID=A0A0A5GQ47_9BACI|nr:cytochrome c oxidase subunit II [Pontibacillus halophilus]KGX93300.1 cytochrome B [Pontibacillus halophilus JSM 076056 = DSM 19796]